MTGRRNHRVFTYPNKKTKQLAYTERVLSQHAQHTWHAMTQGRFSLFQHTADILWCCWNRCTNMKSIFIFTALMTKKHIAYNTLIFRWIIMEVPRSYPLSLPEYSSIKIFFKNNAWKRLLETVGLYQDQQKTVLQGPGMLRLGVDFHTTRSF